MKLVSVLATTDQIEFDMARNLLESAGIQCTSEGGSMSAVFGVEYGGYTSGSTAQELKVREEDVDAAMKLLSEALGEDDDGKAPYSRADAAVDELEESFEEGSDDAPADPGR